MKKIFILLMALSLVFLSSCSTAQEPSSDVDLPGLDSTNWDKLKVGLSGEEVTAILGEPDSTENIDLDGVTYLRWTYQAGPMIDFKDEVVERINLPQN